MTKGAPSFLIATCMAVIGTACAPIQPSGPGVDALVQEGLQTAHAELTAPAPSTAEAATSAGNTFAFGDFGISLDFTYPQGFAEGALAEVLPKMAIQDPADPEYPEHARIILTGSAGENRSNTAPGIRVFRVAEVDAMDPLVVSRLKEVLSGTSEDRFDFPRLPFAGRTVDAEVRTFDFESGTGYRFLLQGSFDASTLRSTGLYYLYQGLSADGKYLVTVLLDVEAPFVADLATGQPITSQEMGDAYLQMLNARVNSAQAGEFVPSLDVLDGLVQSIHITAP